MSDTDTPTRRLPAGGMSLEERLENIEELLHELLKKESNAATDVALIKSKLELHDKILMGVCGIVGTAIVTAVIGLVVIKGHT